MSIVEARCFFHALKEDRTNEEDSQKRNVGAACSPHGIHRACGLGASLGVGASVALEVDVGGMVDTITDTATAAWEGVKSGWKAFTSWF